MKYVAENPRLSLMIVLRLFVLIVVFFATLGVYLQWPLVNDCCGHRRNVSSTAPISTASAATCQRTPVSNADIAVQEQCWSFLAAVGKRRPAGNQSHQTKTAYGTPSYRRLPATSNDYVAYAKDCARFRSTFGYWTSVDDVTEEEKQFPLAFSILMYEQFEQVERLLRLIYRPHNFYCIHVDGKSPPSVHLAARSVVSCLSKNVIVAHPPVNVNWGSFSVLQAELLCIEHLLALNGDWKYFINLVGRDFPLKTNLELVRILKAFGGANDITGSRNGHSMPERVNYVYEDGRRTRRLKTDPPHNLTLSKGSTHIAARREFVDFALNDRRAQDFLHWLRDTQIPDETFFNSLNRNPQLNIPGSYRGEVDTSLINHEKRWSFDGKPCAGRWIHWICNVGVGDLPWIVDSKKMFLNKIRVELEPVAFRCLELWYIERVRKEMSGRGNALNLTFYKNQAFAKLRV